MENMRADFETWVLGQNVCKKYGAKLKQHRDGSYADYRINDRWNAYKAARADVVIPVNAILSGIDKCECQHSGGWWETSTGAEFGAGKLAEVIASVRSFGCSVDEAIE